MKIRHFLLLVVVLMSSWVVGCAPARSGMEYLTSGGRGEVTGQMNGVTFTAVVTLSPNGEHVCVEYLSPDALSGLTLSADTKTCEVRLGEVSFFCDVCEVAGFLRPAIAFMPKGDANSVQREGENTVLSFPSWGRLTLSPKGEPLSLERENIALRMIWWQGGEH